MTPRERWLALLAGKPTDRLPTDYWATAEFHNKLKQALGITDDEQVWQRLGIDRPCFAGTRWKRPHHPDDPQADPWGIRRQAIDYGTGIYDEPVHHPLAHVRGVREVHDFAWPDPDDFEILPLPATAGYRLVFGGHYEPFLLYCAMRGLEQAYEDLVLAPDIATAALDHIFAFASELNRCIWEAGNGRIDVMYLAEDLVQEVGIDFLNPLQWRCPGMELDGLARDFGRQLIFHGGIDNQHTLPFGTPADVRKEVRACATILQGCRWICAPCHNIQNVTPVENVLAMYDEAHAL